MSKKKPAGNRRPGKTEYNVPPEQFIQVWQTSESAQEAADKLGMPKDIVHARASSYRQAGIKLKKMPRHNRRELNVDALNRLIEKIDKEQKPHAKASAESAARSTTAAGRASR